MPNGERDVSHLHAEGWCTRPDHGHGRHTLGTGCWEPESVGERAIAEYQYRVDLRFWQIVEHNGI